MKILRFNLLKFVAEIELEYFVAFLFGEFIHKQINNPGTLFVHRFEIYFFLEVMRFEHKVIILKQPHIDLVFLDIFIEVIAEIIKINFLFKIIGVNFVYIGKISVKKVGLYFLEDSVKALAVLFRGFSDIKRPYQRLIIFQVQLFIFNTNQFRVVIIIIQNKIF